MGLRSTFTPGRSAVCPPTTCPTAWLDASAGPREYNLWTWCQTDDARQAEGSPVSDSLSNEIPIINSWRRYCCCLCWLMNKFSSTILLPAFNPIGISTSICAAVSLQSGLDIATIQIFIKWESMQIDGMLRWNTTWKSWLVGRVRDSIPGRSVILMASASKHQPSSSWSVVNMAGYLIRSIPLLCSTLL